jgi:hypothetical protein
MVNLQDVFTNMKFEETPQGMGYNSRVLLVDSMNLFIRSYAAVPSMDDNGNHIGGMIGFLKSLGLAIRSFKPTRVILVFDGKGGSQRRRKIYPEYKANRKPPVRLNRAYDLTTDDQEKDNMKFQLITLVEILECLPVTIFALDSVEADDVIAHLSKLVTIAEGESIIYSTDKDFFQLASDNIKVYNPVKKKIEALKDYRYSFCIENCKKDYYFTEKLLDCFLSGTVPIYWGCPNLSDFGYDERGIIRFNTKEELLEIINNLTPETYYEMLPYIRHNYNLAIRDTFENNISQFFDEFLTSLKYSFARISQTL